MKGVNGAAQRVLSSIREFTIAQRALALIGVAVLVLGGIALSSWLGRPTYSPLFTGLSGSDASAVVAQLQKDKVDYQLSDGGGTILVPVAKVDQERLAAAAAGLPSSDQNGYALLDNLGVTASEFQQNVTYQRAIQGELAKTIESITGVTNASVQLAIPKPTVFSQSQQNPTASVFVNTVSPLSSAQVQAIVHLTSASVAGLKDTNVTVVDAKGNTLSAVGSGPTGSTADQTTDYETRTKAAVQAMLDSVLGPGNSTVTVAADISASTGTKTTKSFGVAKGSPALSQSSDTSSYKGGGAAGAAGVLGSDTATTSTSSGSGNGTFTSKKAVKNNAIDETTTTQTIPSGVLNRQTIAVAVNSKAAGMSAAQLQKLVAAAAGVNAARGDVVTIATASFSTAAASSAQAALAQQNQAQAQDNMAKIIQNGIWVVGGLLAIVLLFVLTRVRRRKPEASPVNGGDLPVLPRDGTPSDSLLGAAQLGGSAHAASLGAGFPAPPTVALETMPTPTVALGGRPATGDPAFADIEALAQQDPERTAEFLMAMMAGGEEA
jgi:flagellar M-ring protein FliF